MKKTLWSAGLALAVLLLTRITVLALWSTSMASELRPWLMSPPRDLDLGWAMDIELLVTGSACIWLSACAVKLLVMASHQVTKRHPATWARSFAAATGDITALRLGALSAGVLVTGTLLFACVAHRQIENDATSSAGPGLGLSNQAEYILALCCGWLVSIAAEALVTRLRRRGRRRQQANSV